MDFIAILLTDNNVCRVLDHIAIIQLDICAANMIMLIMLIHYSVLRKINKLAFMIKDKFAHNLQMAHAIFKAYKIVLQLIMDRHVLIIWKDGTLQQMD